MNHPITMLEINNQIKSHSQLISYYCTNDVFLAKYQLQTRGHRLSCHMTFIYELGSLWSVSEAERFILISISSLEEVGEDQNRLFLTRLVQGILFTLNCFLFFFWFSLVALQGDGVRRGHSYSHPRHILSAWSW